VERHGGKVTLANLSGGGAQATVVLPRHRPS
jgi:signal transduction histidine kinase